MISHKVLQLSTSNLVYTFPIGPQEPYLFWGCDLDFQGRRGHKGQIRFLEHNSERFWAINLKLHTDTCLGQTKCILILGSQGQIWGHGAQFWGREGQFWGHCNITQNILGLSTWDLLQILVLDQARCLFMLGSLGSILGSRESSLRSLEHASAGFRATNLKLFKTLD